MRTEKDLRNYMYVTLEEDDVPPHADGYFVGFAGTTSVLLVWDPETNKVRRAHHAYVDEYNVRTLETERLTPNSVLLQDLPPTVLDSNGDLDPNKIRLVTSYLRETANGIDPEKSVTITVVLPEKGTSLGITVQDDYTFGFPLLAKVNPTSPLRTQIPMSLQRNCWIVSINSQHGGHIDPITAEFCMSELENRLTRNSDDHEARFELALALNAKGARQAAADSLLIIIRKQRDWQEGKARQQLLQFFEAWGPLDQDTIDARRKLSTLLFS